MRFRRVLAFALLMGCEGGVYEPIEPTGNTGQLRVDGGGTAPAGADGAALAVDAEPIPCEEPVAAPGSGNHNAGLACMTCHGVDPDAPRWTVAGTIFTTLAGGEPLVGATIVITDAMGVEHSLTSRTNGNFFTEDPIAFPIRAHASRCPDARAMTAAVDTGNCNSCHVPGMRITLP